MKNKLIAGAVIFIATCVGFMAYTQCSQKAEKNRIESKIKAQNEQMIKKIDDHSQKGNPGLKVEKGNL
jgi:hypothetical protein